MGTDIKEQIYTALECLPPEMHSDYLSFLSQENPASSSEIQPLKDCFKAPDQAQACLAKILTGKEQSFLPEKMSEDAKFICGEMNDAHRDVKGAGGDGFSYLGKTESNFFIEREKVFHSMSAPEQKGLSELNHFYFQRLSGWVEPLRASLKANPLYEKRLKAYEERSVSVTNLNPVLCADTASWERMDLEVTGLSYRIPIFHPKTFFMPWWQYKETLLGQLEVLKAFLTPSDFEKLLKLEDGRADMGIFISGKAYSSEEPIFQSCHLWEGSEKAVGEFDSTRNRIQLLNGKWRVEDSQARVGKVPWLPIAGERAGTFYHEIAHAIYDRFLDHSAKESIKAMYHWAKQAYAADKADVNHVPQPLHLVDGKPYSLRNEMEFFAEMVEDYLLTRIGGMGAKAPGIQARNALLDEFFSDQGLKPQVFSKANIERIFAEKKIVFAPREGTFTAPLRFSVASSSQTFGQQSFSNLNISLGLALGYLNVPLPSGFFWGAGASGDVTVMGQDFYTAANGNRKPFSSRIYDAGAWGALGYHYNSWEFSAEPGMGYRHVDLLDEKRDTLWFGGDLGFSHHNTGLGAAFRARGDAAGGFLVGGVVELNLPLLLTFGQ